MVTKRHKTFGAAFMVAVAILLVDRLYVLPRGAHAVHSESDPLPAVHSAPEQAETLLAPSKTRTVAERLEALCPGERLQQASLPDAFSLPKVWLSEVDPNGSLSGRVDQEAAFRRRYELLAVAENNGAKCAFVNHHRLEIGQFLEGFELIAIDDRSVTFAGTDSIPIVLRLKESR